MGRWGDLSICCRNLLPEWGGLDLDKEGTQIVLDRARGDWAVAIGFDSFHNTEIDFNGMPLHGLSARSNCGGVTGYTTSHVR